MQKLLIFGLSAVVILFISSSGTVDAFMMMCMTDRLCKSSQKCTNHICENIKCDPECHPNLVCMASNHKAECKCKAGYKLKQHSTIECEKDPQCRGSLSDRYYICSYGNTTVYQSARSWISLTRN
ncbi:hypothetical protein PV327_000463 [Microctonus hyperodae]|uniref:Uncharacterized protein n=1 Tax=Microctonus hyperodae TaxID=165561 RepID=A0AA39G7C4_MICHY|nr:hypothetical protein PV327_000463 [Microctonus hyperodae]